MKTSGLFIRQVKMVLLLLLIAAGGLSAVQPGDFDQNGLVDARDLTILAGLWLTEAKCSCPGEPDGTLISWQEAAAGVSQNWLTRTCSGFVASASSQESSATPPANVLDGTLASRWASVASDNQWLRLDLGQLRRITGLQIYWHTAFASQYAIEWSQNNQQWTTVYSTQAGDGKLDELSITPFIARYIRLQCQKRAVATGGFSIYELYVNTNDTCGPAGQWQLAWADEFDGTQLDTTHWECMTGTGNDAPFDYGLSGWGNNELQYYTGRNQNVRVQNGILILEARKETYDNRSYTSGRIRSAGKMDWMYGRVEASIKMPRGGGMWPAFWMMPTDTTYGQPYADWAAHGEIDIVETANQADYAQGTIHFGGKWPSNAYLTGKYSPVGADFSTAFHTYTLEWYPTQMKWFVDGVLFATQSSWWSANGSYPAPFDQRFHLLLNLAVGGNYAGCTTSSCITATFPQQLQVDFVRIYRKN